MNNPQKTSRSVYFKLATFDDRSFTFRDGKKRFQTESDATKSATKPGKHRVSRVDDSGRHDLDPFVV